jgi:tetratricopeptide (TPR) repeat protein
MRSHEDAGQTKGWIGMNQPVTATTDVYRLCAFGRPTANAARRVSRLGVVFLQCGWVLAIVGCAEPVLPTGSERSDAALVRLGDDLRRNGDLPGATGFYQAALNRDARDPVALQRRGEALLAAGDPVRAEQAFRAPLMSGSAGPDAKRGLAAALLSEGRAADALPLLAADGAGEDVRMLRDRGVALDLLGRPAEAQAAYRAGLRLAPLDAALRRPRLRRRRQVRGQQWVRWRPPSLWQRRIQGVEVGAAARPVAGIDRPGGFVAAVVFFDRLGKRGGCPGGQRTAMQQVLRIHQLRRQSCRRSAAEWQQTLPTRVKFRPVPAHHQGRRARTGVGHDVRRLGAVPGGHTIPRHRLDWRRAKTAAQHAAKPDQRHGGRAAAEVE